MADDPLTIAHLLKQGEVFLKEQGIAAARWEAETLLGHLLGWSRARLYQNLQEEIGERSRSKFGELLTRRGRRVPLQYILGSQDFMGLAFHVDERVLIPRPETELLVERVLFLLQGRNSPRVADLGTGSGAIAISLAVFHPTVEVWAVDLSAAALDLARENARQHQVEDRICFQQGDWLAPLEKAGVIGQLDGIVSNPPYITTQQLNGLDPEVRDHEPRPALDGGSDGLQFYRALARDGKKFLKKDGFMALEIGYDQGEAVVQLLETVGRWKSVNLQQDYAGRDRIVWSARTGQESSGQEKDEYA